MGREQSEPNGENRLTILTPSAFAVGISRSTGGERGGGGRGMTNFHRRGMAIKKRKPIRPLLNQRRSGGGDYRQKWIKCNDIMDWISFWAGWGRSLQLEPLKNPGTRRAMGDAGSPDTYLKFAPVTRTTTNGRRLATSHMRENRGRQKKGRGYREAIGFKIPAIGRGHNFVKNREGKRKGAKLLGLLEKKNRPHGLPFEHRSDYAERRALLGGVQDNRTLEGAMRSHEVKGRMEI